MPQHVAPHAHPAVPDTRALLPVCPAASAQPAAGAQAAPGSGRAGKRLKRKQSSAADDEEYADDGDALADEVVPSAAAARRSRGSRASR